MALTPPPLPGPMAMLGAPHWLQGGALEDALQQIALPRDLLLDFACECTIPALALAKTYKLRIGLPSLDFFAATLQWCQGQLTDAEWQRGANPAWAAMVAQETLLEIHPSTSTQPLEHVKATYQIMRAIAWLGTPSSQEAADMTAWCTAEAQSYLGHESHLNTWLQARRQQRHLLADKVIDQLQTQRTTLLGLLTSRQQRAQVAVQGWQDQLQDALYDMDGNQ